MTIAVVVLVACGVVSALFGLGLIVGSRGLDAWKRGIWTSLGWRVIWVGAALVAAAWLLAPVPWWLVQAVGSVLH